MKTKIIREKMRKIEAVYLQKLLRRGFLWPYRDVDGIIRLLNQCSIGPYSDIYKSCDFIFQYF